MIRLPRLMSCVALAGAAFAAASLIPVPTFAAQPAADEKMTADNAAAPAAPQPRAGRNGTRANSAAGRTGAGTPAAARRGAVAPARPAGRGTLAGDAAAQPAAAKEDAAPEADAAAAPDAAAPPADAGADAAPPAPDAAAPDAAAPDAAAPDAAAPAPDAAAPDAAAPDAAAPDAAAPAPDAAAAPAATEPAAAQPQESSLGESVDNFWHYTLIARYDMAKASGEHILNSGAKPEEVLAAFEQVAARRGRTRAGGAPTESLDAALVRWQGIDPLRDVATRLQQVINQGYTTHVTDQQFIKQQIERLGDNDRAYRNGLQRLRQSGQYAVPMMLRYLRDPAKRELHASIRSALIDMGRQGRQSLSPLLAATDARDNNVLIPVISVLGQIGYPIAVPYLVKVGTDPQAPDSVRNAVERALRELDANASTSNPADFFVDLGEKFYYGTADVQADKRSATSPVWFWDEANGLYMKPVSSAIFNEVMAMRSAETALQLGGGQADAASLWLAADNKREAEMPTENGVDAVNGNRPPAHFYNVALGVQRLNNVLARALKDQNSAVALKAIRSLQGVAGQSSMSEGGGTPLVDAMRFPDRTVRYEAAMAIASALPQQSFNGQELVVPLLAEAVAQSGRPNVLLVVANEADRSRLAGELKGYNTAGGIGATGAIAEARSLPSVDVIFVAADVKDEEIEQLVRLARENGRLDRTAKVIARNNGGGAWAREAINDPTLSITQATDAEGLAKAIEAGRAKTGGLPLDEKVANDFAMRAANLLARLAISRGQVLDLSPALSSLLGSLGDPRPEIVRAVGEAVALVQSPQVQPALLDRAQDPKNAEEVRASLYRSLATSAKFYGNQLAEPQVASLRQNVSAEQNLDVRSAAAEALGALNVPVENVAQLITEPTAAPTQAQPPAGGQQPAAAGQ